MNNSKTIRKFKINPKKIKWQKDGPKLYSTQFYIGEQCFWGKIVGGMKGVFDDDDDWELDYESSDGSTSERCKSLEESKKIFIEILEEYLNDFYKDLVKLI